MVTIAGLMITIMSWIAYKEALSFPQFVGMTFILCAIAMMGFFQKDAEGNEIEMHEATTKMDTDTAISLVTLYGVLAALSFSLEAILIKWLVFRGVQGTDGGYMTLFFDGIYGLILLFYLSANGSGWQIVDVKHIITIIGGGFCTSMALICVNYSVAKGLAGISFSVANSFPAWHAIFNFVVLHQLMSIGQVCGIVLAVSGSIILSVPEKLNCFQSKRKEHVPSFHKANDSISD